jgi:hypothetical protein
MTSAKGLGPVVGAAGTFGRAIAGLADAGGVALPGTPGGVVGGRPAAGGAGGGAAGDADGGAIAQEESHPPKMQIKMDWEALDIETFGKSGCEWKKASYMFG